MGNRGRAVLYVGSTLTAERKSVPVRIDSDPTATVPQFGFVDITDVDEDDTPPGTWTNGTWHDDGYANESVHALTPTLGATSSGAGKEFVAEDKRYRAWIQFTLGTQTFVRPCGYLYTRT